MKKIPNKSFAKYITLWMIIFSIISILAFGIFSFSSIKDSSELLFKQRVDEIIKSANSLFNSQIEHYKNQLSSLSKDEDFLSIISKDDIDVNEKNSITNKLYNILGTKSSSISMHIVKENFNLSTVNTPKMYNLTKFSDWGVLRYAKNNSDLTIYPNYYVWDNENINSFSISEKIIVNDIFYGYIIMDFTSEYIQDLLNTIDTTHIGKVKFVITSLNDFIIFNNVDYKNIRTSNLLKEIVSSNNEYISLNTVNNDIGIKIYGFMNNNYIKTNIEIFYSTLLTTLFPTLLFAGFIAIIISNKMVNPILNLAKRVRGIKIEETSFFKTREDELGEIETAFIELLNKINEYHLIDIEKREQLKIAEVKMLQSQINPHFLYNTLDSIKWKAKLNGVDDIAKMATELGNVLKSSMNYNETIVSVKEELKLIQSYIYIQKERYSDRFEFILNAQDEVLDCLIPKFLLQPLIENAIVHGMEEISSKGIIKLNAFIDEKYLYFEVIDNGKGFNRSLDEILNDNSSRSIALKNVNKRIKLYYGDDFGLSLDTFYKDGSKIVFKILKEI